MEIPARIRYAPTLRDAARLALRPVIARRAVPGTPFVVRFPAWQHLGLLLPGDRTVLEPEIVGHIQRWVRPGQTVIDVGANIGVHTLLLAQLVGPGGKVHCFEPDPQSSRWLLENVRLSGLDQVTPWSLALGSRDGVAELHLDIKASRTTSLLSGWVPPIDHHSRQRMRVATARLDDLQIGKVDFVKIDVEGTELDVLAGARETIAASRPVVLVEVLDVDRLNELVSMFSALNYSVADARYGAGVGPGSGSGNLIAIPESGLDGALGMGSMKHGS
jgi:FkbM family methyltransferase